MKLKKQPEQPPTDNPCGFRWESLMYRSFPTCKLEAGHKGDHWDENQWHVNRKRKQNE